MKTASGIAVVSCAMLLVVSACSFAAGLPALPTSEFADTEVSTNVVFAVGEGGGRRLVFSLELEATPSKKLRMENGKCRIENRERGRGNRKQRTWRGKEPIRNSTFYILNSQFLSAAHTRSARGTSTRRGIS